MEKFQLNEIKAKLAASDFTKDNKDILIFLIDKVQELTEELAIVNAKLTDTLEYAELLEQDMDNVKEELFGVNSFDAEEDEGEYNYTEIQCKTCGENIYVEEALLKEKLSCPNCNGELIK
ncbi:hypothetical protein ACPWSR_17155 [Alloiococcus sp. CFN-8]|uniref:hypothetical protein n=1 Tax=Alloiococcus sp. CFN-8 TaxID=3416081 RepID=UPI003CED1AA5